MRTLGKCLDVVDASSANATPVQLWDCNGSPAQQWVPGANGGAAQRRLGALPGRPGNAGKPGDRPRIHDCNSAAAQRFGLGS